MTCGDAAVGVTSWGVVIEDTCQVSYPSVYTRINSFEDWIDERIPGLP